MKTFLAILAAFLLSTPAYADSKWYYDIERSGEGMILTDIKVDGRFALTFYSHVEDKVSIPPVVSPPRPPSDIVCDRYTVWFTGLSTYVRPDKKYAEGNIYYDVAVPDFPLAVDGNVSESFVVAKFYLTAKGDGFILHMKSNYNICNLSVFGVDHYMTTVLTE